MDEKFLKQINRTYAKQAFNTVISYGMEIEALEKENVLSDYEYILEQDLEVLTDKIKQLQICFDAIRYIKEINPQISFLAMLCNAMGIDPIKMTLKEYISLEKAAEILDLEDIHMPMEVNKYIEYFKEYYSKNF